MKNMLVLCCDGLERRSESKQANVYIRDIEEM